MFKKIYLVIPLVIIIVVLVLVSNLTGKEIPVKQDRYIVLKVAGDNNFPPYEYIDENSSYTGFNVDIMRVIALTTGIDIQFHPMSWNDACEKLKNGEVDIIEGMKYTKDRDRYYDFSSEYLENSQSIFVLSNNRTINEFEDLKYKKVAIQKGDIAVSNLNELKDVNIKYTDNQEQAIQALLKGTADAYIGNTLTGVFLINKIGARNGIKIVGKTLNPTKYSLAVKNGDTETLDIINKGLKEIKRNGTYDKIYRKWFGQPVNMPSWYINRMIFFSSMIILVLTIIMLVFYRWNSALKKEVDKQTRKINTANEILVKKNSRIKLERDFREQILNNIFSGVATINSEGIISFTNRLAQTILNTNKTNLTGKHFEDTLIKEFFSWDDVNEDNRIKELMINNRKVYLSYKVSLLNSTDKDMNEAIIIFRDMTEEVLMQENIRTKDKLQSLGNLVSGIAHEIRNPLTSIKTYAELIPRKFDNPKFRTMVSRDIPQEIDRLNTLINDLLEYSRPRKPFKERILLCDAVNGAMLLLKNKVENEKIVIENYIDKEIFVCIDKNHFRQVLINIILNAIESMDKAERKIELSSESSNDNIFLFIKDNGCGIDEESMNKIFNPFYTTKPTGTGLGLFVSYQLLSENNAEIMLDSTAGIGTTFTIKFKDTEVDNNGEAFDC